MPKPKPEPKTVPADVRASFKTRLMNLVETREETQAQIDAIRENARAEIAALALPSEQFATDFYATFEKNALKGPDGKVKIRKYQDRSMAKKPAGSPTRYLVDWLETALDPIVASENVSGDDVEDLGLDGDDSPDSE